MFQGTRAVLGGVDVTIVATSVQAETPFRFVSAPDLVNADVRYRDPRAFDLDETAPDYAAHRQTIGRVRQFDPRSGRHSHRPDFHGDSQLRARAVGCGFPRPGARVAPPPTALRLRV